jgi:excisionase family DNA binding protein
MTTDEKIATTTIDEVMKLAHERTEELFRHLGPRLPAEVRQEISRGVDAILEEALSQHPALKPDNEEFMSTAEAAKLLFVSRPHVVKLIEQGKLELHHMTGQNRFVKTESVRAYQQAQQTAIAAYQSTAGQEE